MSHFFYIGLKSCQVLIFAPNGGQNMQISIWRYLLSPVFKKYYTITNIEIVFKKKKYAIYLEE
jgi:hypothetical protein